MTRHKVTTDQTMSSTVAVRKDRGMIPMTMSKLRMRCPGGSSFMTEYPLNDEHIKLYVTDLTRSMLDTIFMPSRPRS